MNISYEKLRNDLEELRSATGETRNLNWLAHELAVGRNASADFEIFLRGECLKATSPLVRRHLQHGSWMPKTGGQSFEATRIVLPSAPHFSSVAALIAVELLRGGIAGPANPQQAFSDVEPIIEMAIRRGALPENVVVGLIGELVLLRQCLLATLAEPERHAGVLNAWQGWQHGGRDMRIGRYAIEVKTTQSVSSIHEFSGIHQLEPKQLPNGDLEEIFVFSCGLIASDTTGESLPELIDSICSLLVTGNGSAALPLQEALLEAIENYGNQSGPGYNHLTMRDWSAYATKYSHTFVPRLYRIDDPAMLLLQREALERTIVIPSSVAFTAHFPDRISAFNPPASWLVAIADMIKNEK